MGLLLMAGAPLFLPHPRPLSDSLTPGPSPTGEGSDMLSSDRMLVVGVRIFLFLFFPHLCDFIEAAAFRIISLTNFLLKYPTLFYHEF